MLRRPRPCFDREKFRILILKRRELLASLEKIEFRDALELEVLFTLCDVALQLDEPYNVLLLAVRRIDEITLAATHSARHQMQTISDRHRAAAPADDVISRQQYPTLTFPPSFLTGGQARQFVLSARAFLRTGADETPAEMSQHLAGAPTPQLPDCNAIHKVGSNPTSTDSSQRIERHKDQSVVLAHPCIHHIGGRGTPPMAMDQAEPMLPASTTNARDTPMVAQPTLPTCTAT